MLDLKLNQECDREAQVETFSLNSSSLIRSSGLRLDASYYNPRVVEAISALKASGWALIRLGDVTSRIFVPPRFKRIYVSPEHGIPFLSGSHMVHFQPADLRYLSRVAYKTLDPWIIEAGWVLVTCSGTIGRTTIALRQWHEWAASQHIMRVVPQVGGPVQAGYLYAFLTSPFEGVSKWFFRMYTAV